MIKKFLLGSVVLAVSSASALAADLPSRRAPPVYIPPPLPVFSWTGAYIGGTAGYAFDSRNSVAFIGANGLAARAGQGAAATSNGFTGGGTIGYNFSTQSLPVLNSFAGGFAGGGLVFGVEADAAYTDLQRSTAFAPGAAFSGRTDFVGTVRGRLGLAFDRLMVYGTGGFAYGGIRDNVNIGGRVNYNANNEKLQTGYAYGGGIEYALPTTSFVNVFNSSAVTLKAEFIRYDLGHESFAVTASNGANFTARNRVEGNLVRAGLNFKFGSPIAPVVARY